MGRDSRQTQGGRYVVLSKEEVGSTAFEQPSFPKERKINLGCHYPRRSWRKFQKPAVMKLSGEKGGRFITGTRSENSWIAQHAMVPEGLKSIYIIMLQVSKDGTWSDKVSEKGRIGL